VKAARQAASSPAVAFEEIKLLWQVRAEEMLPGDLG